MFILCSILVPAIKRISIIKYLVLVLFFLKAGSVGAQNNSSTLFALLKTQDSLLFEAGYNACDTSVLDRLISKDFEFYHDEAGVTSSKAKFIGDFKQHVCNLSYSSKRILDPNSLRVYPLYHKGSLYGAVQTGTHRFFKTEGNQVAHLTGRARFTHVWLLDGQWKLTRAISYDHQEAPSIRPDFEDPASVAAWLQSNKIPSLAIGIIKDSVLQQVKVFGVLAKGKPAPYDLIHNVASITKLITTMTTLRLVSAGKWSLDEPLYYYWIDPDIAGDPRHQTLTTRHVLNHQSGFPNWRWELPDKKLAFGHTPGTQYGYSGEGFEYLRRALERKFNLPFDSFVDQVLLRPLGMSDSKLTWSEAMTGRFAVPHNAEGEEMEITKNTRPNAADLFKTTVPDLARFLISTLRNEGLDGNIAEQMVAHATKTKENRYIGLGWFIYDIGNNEYALSHGGDDAGSRSICFLLPKTGDGLIIFSNSDNAPQKVYSEIIRAYLGEKGQTIIDIELK